MLSAEMWRLVVRQLSHITTQKYSSLHIHLYVSIKSPSLGGTLHLYREYLYPTGGKNRQQERGQKGQNKKVRRKIDKKSDRIAL
jgi:hypothetical protein